MQTSNPFDNTVFAYDQWFESERGQRLFNCEVDCLGMVMPSRTGRWLEVGVGTGRFATAMGISDGIDPSEAMLRLAEQRGIRTTTGVGEQLPYATGDFEGILITTTLCFLKDPNETLKQCHRVLRTQGQLVVGVIPADSRWGQLYARKAAGGHPLYSRARFYSCCQVLHLANHAGFQLTRAYSTLLLAPESLHREEIIRKGIVEGAGFVAMAFTKTPERESG